MKTIVVLAALVAVLYAKTFQMTMKHSGSIRAKLIKEGRYQSYLEEMHLARTQVLATGSQPIIDYYDGFYLGNITIGTPGQTMTVVLDTTSSNLWVIDAACKTAACNGGGDQLPKKNKFDTTKSTTFVKEARTFSIQYGDGKVSGYLGTDVLQFGGLSVAKQEFGVATQVGETYGYEPLDGIFGLGWPALAVNKVVPPMQNVLSQLDSKLFTIWLDRKLTFVTGEVGGLITYGATDSVNCDSKITYVPLSSETYWQFPISGFAIGDYTVTRKDQVISGTSYTMIGAPSDVMKNVVTQTGAKYDTNSGLYLVPCTNQKTLPDLIFTINGVTYNVPSVEYIVDEQIGNGQCVLTFFSMQGGGFGPSWVLGDPWIRTYCNVYDIGNSRIGFSKANHQLSK